MSVDPKPDASPEPQARPEPRAPSHKPEARPEPQAPSPTPILYRYHQTILSELAGHGLAPGPDTSPAFLREQINDLYRFEIRKLRDRCRAGEIPVQELSAHVIELRKRYTLLSIPVDRWSIR